MTCWKLLGGWATGVPCLLSVRSSYRRDAHLCKHRRSACRHRSPPVVGAGTRGHDSPSKGSVGPNGPSLARGARVGVRGTAPPRPASTERPRTRRSGVGAASSAWRSARADGLSATDWYVASAGSSLSSWVAGADRVAELGLDGRARGAARQRRATGTSS